MTRQDSPLNPEKRAAWTGVPPAARSRLIGISIGWVVVAVAEVTAYCALALAIRDHGGLAPVLITAGIALLVTVLISRAGYLTGAWIAGDLYSAMGVSLARAKLSWFTADHRALITTAAGRSVPVFMGVPAHQLQTLILAPLIPLLSTMGILIVSGAVIAAIVLAGLTVAFVVQFVAQRLLARADAQRQAREQRADAATLELVDQLELLRSAAGPSRALDRAEKAWREQEEALARTNRAAAPAVFLSSVASVFPLAVALFVVVFSGGLADPAAALALLVLTARAGAPIDDLALIGLAINDLRTHTRAYQEVALAPVLPRGERNGALTPDGHRISLEFVSRPPALEAINETIPEGARIHLAGPSGAGKSTLVGLMMRFDDPTFGRITLGGIPLTDFDEDTLTAQIAYVPQDAILFTGSLAENIRIGRPDATDAEVVDAASRAQLDDLVSRDPRGIGLPVGTHGQALSGGERQRVAIARALLKRAPVLVLDEATSALDDATEQRVAEAIAPLGATIIVITHRDPSVWRPDRTITLTGAAGASS